MKKTESKSKASATLKGNDSQITNSLFKDVSLLIEQSRQLVARAVNTEITMLYWRIGNRVRQYILKEKRADYGQRVVFSLSIKLAKEYGSGFAEKNLRRMLQFAEVFHDWPIVVTLSRQLGWSHFVELIPLKDELQRNFYAEMCRIERWSVRRLREKINGMLYERTALSKKPKDLIKQELASLHGEDKLTPDLVFRDPYILDFLNLKDTYNEKDMESAILREMEAFILELGAGFSFVARQKRITVDAEDYYLDLLFYHRRLRRLVAIELKLDRFKSAYKGQMELYLRWLEKYEQQHGEESPIGLILCAGKSSEHVELLQLEQSGIRVAEYLTELPPRELLEKKLHEVIRRAREQIAARQIAGRKREKS
jgi:predicted nuclease of restriction endonuclease-like (RecB) superfamily